jgi:hypothetical protein
MGTIREMHKDQRNVTKLRKHISQPFEVNRGLRQECFSSPTLFKNF